MRSIESLRCFLAVVDEGSFSGAARRLNLAVSSVSRYVQLLEQELKAPLLTRHTRTLSLTETGRLVYEQGQDICSRIDGLGEQVARRTQEVRGWFGSRRPYGLAPTVLPRGYPSSNTSGLSYPCSSITILRRSIPTSRNMISMCRSLTLRIHPWLHGHLNRSSIGSVPATAILRSSELLYCQMSFRHISFSSRVLLRGIAAGTFLMRMTSVSTSIPPGVGSVVTPRSHYSRQP